uniref:non-specific serine/threonine protein kinase n=1 Tax=Salix viminalis TaxID=40686 RepID=A0A6N2MVR8_SALVM
MASNSHFLVLCLFFISSVICQVTEFISIDCGGTGNYTDPRTGLAWISDNGTIMNYGKSSEVESPDENMQYRRRRDFPIDSRKYCYTLGTRERRRYLVRATFQYGSSGNEDAYPKFDLYLDATKWSTVVILDSSRVYVKEMIIRAPSSSVDVCICCATTGSPFISTLELRPLNLSMYPDDPYDRIWDSDLEKRQNYLVGVAPGTVRINTSKYVDTRTREYPPVKVMQTAVVGTQGILSYRLNLDDFPANARAFAYFAEIEDLGANETRKFKLQQPYFPDYSNAVVNIAENANGSHTLYEPSYMNTRDSTQGPLLNAIEISKYLKIEPRTDSQDVIVLNALRSMSAESAWTNEQGDPCVPAHWDWVNCSTSTTPPRITKIALSGKNLRGEIPSEINNMETLTELWLDGNFLTGPIPGISDLVNLKIVHLENNKLSGQLPKYLGSLPNLQELYIQNNSFTGEVPSALLTGKVIINYEHNPGLHKEAGKKMHSKSILGISIGILAAVLVVLIGSLLFLRNLQRKTSHKKTAVQGSSLRVSAKPSTAYSVSRGWHMMDEGVSYYIPLSELEEATNKFSKKIGRGSFGTVYYGQMKDGKEVAVKIMGDSTTNMTQQFVTERLDWLARLQIAEDSAKGLEYLHTGCIPSIIHRDVKTSNILLDINMRAKVSDFGLSRQAEEDLTHVSSVARGTVGYLDPEYYANQQLTEKSDVYSFGVVLLELLSGKKPARALIRKGDVMSIVDPVLIGNVKIESIWRIAEVAIQSVEQHAVSRPRMQEIILAIQEANKIEKGTYGSQKLLSGSSKAQSSRKTLLESFLEIESQSPDLSNGCLVPAAR